VTAAPAVCRGTISTGEVRDHCRRDRATALKTWLFRPLCPNCHDASYPMGTIRTVPGAQHVPKQRVCGWLH